MFNKLKPILFFSFVLSVVNVNAFSATTSIINQSTLSFENQKEVNLNSIVLSNYITIQDVKKNAKVTISIKGGKFSINDKAFRTSSTTVTNGNRVRIQQTSAKTYNTTTTSILKVGELQSIFSSTTINNPKLLDSTPDIFTFEEQKNVTTNSLITSNTITIQGINTPTQVSIVGGEYAINNGAFLKNNAYINNGDKITVRLFSSPIHNTITQAILTIGTIQGAFSISTRKSIDNFFLPETSSGDPGFFSTYFQGDVACARCHNNLVDARGNDVAIQQDWSATMMANASRDPLWKAKVRSELNRNPQLASVINDKCTRCHAPMANFEAQKENVRLTQTVFDEGQYGLLNALHPKHDAAMSGVSCTLCHQIQSTDNLGKLSGFSGGYTIGDNLFLYGQYENPVTLEMLRQTIGYSPVYSKHISSSKLCATCHNLKTPYVDQFGKIISTTSEDEFPEQMSYTEWEQSDYAKIDTAKECQDCHMPRFDNVKIATLPTTLTPRDNFRKHDFVGANKLMLDIFNHNKKQLGVLASTSDFDETIEKTQTMLNNAATITKISSTLSNATLSFSLKINSTTGHKLPSAYPSRRVILHVKVSDDKNKTVFESGKIKPDGSVTGADADSALSKFEPHYDVIDTEDKVQIYEAIMGNNQYEPTYTLLRGMTYLKDNRILPIGFNKMSVPKDVRVVGEALDDVNFIGGSDQITYNIKGVTGSSYVIEAELIHQPVSYAFSQDLFSESTNEADDFGLILSNANFKSNQISALVFNVKKE